MHVTPPPNPRCNSCSTITRASEVPNRGRPRPAPVSGIVAITLVVMTLASAGCATADGLSQVRLVVGEDLNIHTMNGKGDEFHEVVLRRKTGGTQRGALWDAYFQPSLAPDGGAVACIRFRNYTRLSSNDPALLPRQSSEIVIFHPGRTGKRATQVVYSVPGEAGVVYRLSSPIWSHDGRALFFVVGSRVLAYSLDTAETETVAELPSRVFAGFSEVDNAGTYLSLSRDGEHIFALLTEVAPIAYSIWRIRWATRAVAKLWGGPWFGSHSGRFDQPFPPELDDAAIEALFGSREFPVLAPRFSADRRYYFFVKRRPGFFGRLWVAGYDREARREFTVRTLDRGLLWK